MKIRLDKRTKMDKVVVQDMVKAYITDKGHTPTYDARISAQRPLQSRRRRHRRRLLVVHRQLFVREGGCVYGTLRHGFKKSVKRAMHQRKKGTLSSGESRETSKDREQAIAIGLSEARRKGAKVPRKKAASPSGLAPVLQWPSSGLQIEVWPLLLSNVLSSRTNGLKW